MTAAAKLDPALCRKLAGRCADMMRDPGDYRTELQQQLTAAADLAEREPLTEQQVREVVSTEVTVAWADYDDGSLDRESMVDAIATRAAKELAGAVVGLSSENARELEARRSLDAHRKAEIEELVARRQADLDADDRRVLSVLAKSFSRTSSNERDALDRLPLAAAFDRAALAITGLPRGRADRAAQAGHREHRAGGHGDHRPGARLLPQQPQRTARCRDQADPGAAQRSRAGRRIVTVSVTSVAEPPALSPDHRYHAAFDAIAAIQADLVLYEVHHPSAGAALVEWATTRGDFVSHRHLTGWPAGMLSVTIGTSGTTNSRSIDVYLR